MLGVALCIVFVFLWVLRREIKKAMRKYTMSQIRDQVKSGIYESDQEDVEQPSQVLGSETGLRKKS